MEFLHPPPRRLAHHPASQPLGDRAPDEHCPRSRFPTSSDRLGWPAGFPSGPVPALPARYDPLGSLAQDELAMARRTLYSAFVPRFFPGHVARGVLSDGTWTTAHPSVHAFLQSPSSPPSLTSRTSAAIYSLAALHVFYSPSHPSYDAFWRPDIKESTAMFVHHVVTMKPSPISTTPMTWLGIHDMLWQLTGIQKEYFKSQGGKPTVQPLVGTRRSLRKRKPVQALLQELCARELSEAPEPPRKKIKISKSDESEKGSEATLPVALDQSDISVEHKAGPSGLPRNKSIVPSSHETQGNADATPSPLTITSSLPPESHSLAKEDATQAGTSRGRGKDAVGKKVQANPAPSRSSARRARERSPSFSSGSSTAVSAAGGNSKRARSSSSASSTSTTVVAETGANSSSVKGKGKAKADVAAEEETEEEEGDDEVVVVVGKRSNRPRRSTAKNVGAKPTRKQGATTSLQSTAEIDKLASAEAPPRRVRSRSGVTSSRSRKRKS